MNFLLSLKFIYSVIGIIFLSAVGYGWFYLVRNTVESYLNNLCEIINCPQPAQKRIFPFYSKSEVTGTFKDRQVIAGLQYIGLGFEWMPMPFIRIKLKDVIRYNYNRIPNFAFIERGWLVLRINERLTWGIFDKSYVRFFTKDFINVALERLLSVAEDAERGKTLGEVFK